MSTGRPPRFELFRTWEVDIAHEFVQDKKEKKSKDEDTVPIEELSPIAQPLAQKKLLKKLHKTIKKGASVMTRVLHAVFLNSQ